MREGEVRVGGTKTHVRHQKQTGKSGGSGGMSVCSPLTSRARLAWLSSPGYGRHAPSVLVDKVAAGVEDPAVVEGHEGVSGCGGRVLPALGVGVLQRGELVLPQHLVHNKLPGGATQRHTCDFTTRGLA